MSGTTTLIPPAYFYDTAIFQNEKLALFEKTWQFAGFTSDVAHPDMMFCTDIAGKSVVIKNFNETLRAFHNVCSHRFSRICNGPTKGPLQCPYHGWTYNEEGVPYAIPKRKQFGSLDLNELSLKPYALETCGKFIFVKASLEGPDLKTFLGHMAPILEKVSAAMGLRLDENSMNVMANWKLVVENTLESYHVREVHPDSLYKVGIQESLDQFEEMHSSTLMKFNTQLAKNAKIANVYATRPWQIEDYLHILIFPNLTIASAFGTTLSIQQITPLSATETRFVSHVFGTNLDEKITGSAIVKAFNESAVHFNRQVFAEDKQICEMAQKGIAETTRTHGVLCDEEKRVWAFEKAYMTYMTGQ